MPVNNRTLNKIRKEIRELQQAEDESLSYSTKRMFRAEKNRKISQLIKLHKAREHGINNA